MNDAAPVPMDENAKVKNYLELIRPKMLTFVSMQIGDEHLVEGLVQDAYLEALKNAASFRGEAAFRTWVFAILKRKIVDHIRTNSRNFTAKIVKKSANPEENFDLLFDHKGYWHTKFRPIQWDEPEDALSDQQFWLVFDTCLNELPERQCTIFMMREYLGLSCDEVRRNLGVSLNLVNVNLYRARLRLQQCLSMRWFGAKR